MILIDNIWISAVIVSDCTQAVPSVAGGVAQTTGTNCPRYPTRYEGDALVIEIEKGECEMWVIIIVITKEFWESN